jgi:hypothetical protein
MRNSMRMIFAGHVARMLVKRKAYRILVENSEIKGPLGRQVCSLVGNIKKEVGEIRWDVLD